MAVRLWMYPAQARQLGALIAEIRYGSVVASPQSTAWTKYVANAFAPAAVWVFAPAVNTGGLSPGRRLKPPVAGLVGRGDVAAAEYPAELSRVTAPPPLQAVSSTNTASRQVRRRHRIARWSPGDGARSGT